MNFTIPKGGPFVLKKLALSFVKAFFASFIVLVPGILYAPNFTAAKAAGVAALIASVDAGFKALQIATKQ